MHGCLAGASCKRCLDLLGELQTAHCSADDPNTNVNFLGNVIIQTGQVLEQIGSESSSQKSFLLSFQIIPSGRVYAQPVCKLSFIQPYAPWNETKLINISNAPRDTLNPFTFRWSTAEAGHALRAVRMLSHSAARWPQSPVCLVSVNTKAPCPRHVIKQNSVYSATVWVRGVDAMRRQPCPDTYEPCQRPRSCSIQPTILLKNQNMESRLDGCCSRL